MYQAFIRTLSAWNRETDARQKMQHSYALLAVVLLVIAGLVSLVNYRLSQNLLTLVFFAVAIFAVNTVMWALLQSLVILPLEKRRSARPATTRSRK